MPDGPVGPDEPQLKGTSWILRLSGTADIETVTPGDPTWPGLRRRVVPDLGSMNLHYKEKIKISLRLLAFSNNFSSRRDVQTVMLMKLLCGEFPEGEFPSLLCILYRQL